VKYEDLVSAAQNEVRQVVRIWHPEPKETLIYAKNGSGIEVLEGKPSYQLSSGEVIEV
jgi:hypothetical protein